MLNEGFAVLRRNIEDEIKHTSFYGSQLEQYSKTKSMKETLTKGKDYIKKFVFYCCENLIQENQDYTYREGNCLILKSIFQVSSLDWQLEDILTCINLSKEYLSTDECYDFYYPTIFLVDYISNYISENELNDDIIYALNLLKFERNYAEFKQINQTIDALLERKGHFQISNFEFNSLALNDFLKTVSNEDHTHWIKLFRFCRDEAMKSLPTKKWLSETQVFIKKEIKISNFISVMQDLLQKATEYLKEKHKEPTCSAFSLEIYNAQHSIFKALLWNCGIAGEEQLHQQLFEFANWAFKKYTGYGVLAQGSGLGALQAFSQLPIKEGVPRLMSLKNKTSNKIILKSIEKHLKEAAKNNKMSFENIEELSIPTYGMSEVGVLEMDFGTIKSKTIFKANGKNETIWENNGKNQASVPAAVKMGFANELKILKNTIKEVEQLLPSQRQRIENQYLAPVSWTYKDWHDLYISHQVMGIIGQTLIWNFDTQQGIFNQDKKHFENANGEILDIKDNAKVTLWHPLVFSEKTVSDWRNYLINKEIIQPFKQAFREVYIITEAELNTMSYSNRFAAHILRQHQFNTLAKLRDWHYTLQGQWDSHNTPFKKLKHWNIEAQYLVDAVDAEASQAGIFNYISTDQVRFFKDRERIDLIDVPAIVFSEIMRDVDMFVGVCSIGNDPNWENNPNGRDYNTYWHNYSFGEITENAKIRKQTLETLIPRLKIASLCHFEGNFLVVKGKIRSYKIHLGSGNILMTPNDQYLCIVPDGSKKMSDNKVFLPFEGDSILSIILSKAFMLADDDKITDITITRQIRS